MGRANATRTGRGAWCCSTTSATPRDLSPGATFHFLEHVAQSEPDALNRLEEAHTALTFLCHQVLGLAIGDLPCPEPPRLLDRLRRACRVRQFSPRTEDCYAMWAERFIRFHGLRHPNALPETRQQVGLGQQLLAQANRRILLAIDPVPLVHVDGDETS